MENKQVVSLTNEIHTTQLGKCEWAHILKAQTKFDSDGIYSIKLILGEVDAEPIKDLVRHSAEAHHQLETQMGHSVAGWALPPWTFDKETSVYKFNFKQKAIGKPKNEEPFPISIDVFDAKINPWPKDVLIGNGSLVKVAFTLYSWNSAAQNGVGVTLQLKAVQVVNHIPYEHETRDYGFQLEEGVDMGVQPFHAETPSDGQGNGAGNEDIPLEGALATASPYGNHTEGPVTDGVPF